MQAGELVNDYRIDEAIKLLEDREELLSGYPEITSELRALLLLLDVRRRNL